MVKKTSISMPIMYDISNFHSIHKVKLFFKFCSQNTCISKANIDKRRYFKKRDTNNRVCSIS